MFAILRVQLSIIAIQKLYRHLKCMISTSNNVNLTNIEGVYTEGICCVTYVCNMRYAH
jgi:hypothetical protein